MIRRIGGGGMGSVYEGEEPNIGRRVAIKILRARLADDPEFVERFRNEARLANAVQHPAIVDVFSFGRLDDGRPFFVMPLLEGESVRELLDREGSLPPARCWAIGREIASALGAAHDAGLIHRDLKPDNVFLERKGDLERVRVMDFGIAKSVAASGDALAPKTQTGMLLGTPAYMAPEQWWGAKLDARVDQYALGAMLFEMLSGQPPFDPNHESGVMKLHLHEPPPSLASRGTESSAEADALVQRLLAKDPNDRFASMNELIAAGDACWAAGSTEATEIGLAATELGPMPAESVGTSPEAAQPSRAAAVPSAPLRRSWLVTYVVCVMAALGALWIVGYAGPARWHPVEWFRISGFAAFPAVAVFVVAAVVLPVLVLARDGARRFRVLTLGLAIGPALIGAVGTYAGWETVTRALADVDSTQRFEVFNEGSYEAGANRFLGFGLSVGLCLALAAVPGGLGMAGSSAQDRGRRLAPSLAVAVALLAIIAGLLGAPSAVLVAVPAALFLWSSRLFPIGGADLSSQVGRSVYAGFALFFASATAIERVAARRSVLWTLDAGRAERIREIMVADWEQSATWAAILFVSVTVVVVQGQRLSGARDLFGHLRRHALLGSMLFAVIALDLSLAAKFGATGRATREALAGQFALFAGLDPPSTDMLPSHRLEPSQGAALQVAQTGVAVDGREVTRLNAAASAVGRERLQNALFDALARASTTPLSCLVDRRVTWAELRELLAIARLAGATDAELLFTRGPAPMIPSRGPAEVGWIQPKDFIAVRVSLAADGIDLDSKKQFGELAAELLASAHGRQPLAIRVPAGRDPGR